MGSAQSVDKSSNSYSDPRMPFEEAPVGISDRLLMRIADQLPKPEEPEIDDIQEEEEEDPYDPKVIKQRLDAENEELENTLNQIRQEREQRSKEERQQEDQLYSIINTKIQQSQNILFINKLKKNKCYSVDQSFQQCLKDHQNQFDHCLSFYEAYHKCMYDNLK